jgi:hypothetical protein
MADSHHRSSFWPVLFSLIVLAIVMGKTLAAAEPTSTVSSAPDTKVFGLQLGADLSLQECQKTKVGNRYFYTWKDTAWCYQHWNGPLEGAVVTETVEIAFPFADRPQLTSDLALIGQVIDGKLEGISFGTLGAPDQDRVLQALTGKYGKPTVSRSYETQTYAGAKFRAVKVIWMFSDLIVTFEGVTDRVDRGLVKIDTPSAVST